MRETTEKSRDRGAFALLLALVVLAVAVITIGFNFKRVSGLAIVTEYQIDEYHMHHELMGSRDIVSVWLKRDPPVAQFPEFARTGDPAYRVVLPDGMRLSIFVDWGQNTMLANLNKAQGNDQALNMLRIIQRIPEDRPDLLRTGGPYQVNVNGMEDELIDAICGEQTEIADLMRRMRDNPDLQEENFNVLLVDSGVDREAAREIITMLTWRPTLWELRVDVEPSELIAPNRASRRGEPLRRYKVLADIRGSIPTIHQWRTEQVPEAELREVAQRRNRSAP